MKYRNASLHQFIFCCFTRVLISQMWTIKMMTSVAGGSSPLALYFPLVLQVMCCINIKEYSSNQTKSCQEQLEHAEVSTALRYLGQYYFKNKLYDEASLCAQRCCDYNDVSVPVRFEHLVLVAVVWYWSVMPRLAGTWGRKGSVAADLTGQRSNRDAFSRPVCTTLKQQHSSQEGVSPEPHLIYTLTPTLFFIGLKKNMDNLPILWHETALKVILTRAALEFT